MTANVAALIACIAAALIGGHYHSTLLLAAGLGASICPTAMIAWRLGGRNNG